MNNLNLESGRWSKLAPSRLFSGGEEGGGRQIKLGPLFVFNMFSVQVTATNGRF